MPPTRASTRCGRRCNAAEEPAFTADYHDPEKRSIANSLTLTFRDGTTLTETVEYPLGHRRRRSEGIPLLEEKFRTNLAAGLPRQQQQAILEASLDQQALERMPVQEYVDLYASAELDRT